MKNAVRSLAGIALSLFACMASAVEVNLDQYRGRVVYLDFWASWCTPCRASFPYMHELTTKYAGQGLTVVAVNLDTDQTAAEAFLKSYPVNFEIVFDPSGESAKKFGLKGMPSSYLFDRQGRLVNSHVGFRRKDMPRITAEIQSLLAEQEN